MLITVWYPFDPWVRVVEPRLWSFGDSCGNIYNFKPYTHISFQGQMQNTQFWKAFWECIRLESGNLGHVLGSVTY